MSSLYFPSVGIDVGGYKKGFHAVALDEKLQPTLFHATDPARVAEWAGQELSARIIAIDAPCRWSLDGQARPCEKALMQEGISCFPTPTLAKAQNHHSGYYDWMLNGAALYETLERSHPLLKQLPLAKKQQACFETFPHAITRALWGADASAKHKREQRGHLLIRAGIDITDLCHIDWIDAACCALAAHSVAMQGPCMAHGEPETGLLVHPKSPSA